MHLKQTIATELDAARTRSLGLLAPLDTEQLCAQHSQLMSPLAWDLAHIGNYEDHWLLRALGQPGVGAAYDDLYDAFRHPRRTRAALAMLAPDQARAYLHEVRERVLDTLVSCDLDADDPLRRNGYVYGMVVQHEHQHIETMLAALQLLPGDGYRPYEYVHEKQRCVTESTPSAEVYVPGGRFIMGTDDEPWAYDNERPAHLVDVAPFLIDTEPVNNATFISFIDAGGYDDPRWWDRVGWAWRQEATLEHPGFWRRDGDGWCRNRFGRQERLDPNEPVQHVCWYEADACARFLGKRLPTEAEWEKAASWDPIGDHKKQGLQQANFGGQTFRPLTWQSFPHNVSACGARQMLGDVWEWTSSDFAPYPGFAAFPYREYSDVFYGPEYKVLRGGSWATHPTAIRTTFRNWDYPIRRQIFAGFRCARSAA